MSCSEFTIVCNKIKHMKYSELKSGTASWADLGGAGEGAGADFSWFLSSYGSKSQSQLHVSVDPEQEPPCQGQTSVLLIRTCAVPKCTYTLWGFLIRKPVSSHFRFRSHRRLGSIEEPSLVIWLLRQVKNFELQNKSVLQDEPFFNIKSTSTVITLRWCCYKVCFMRLMGLSQGFLEGLFDINLKNCLHWWAAKKRLVLKKVRRRRDICGFLEIWIPIQNLSKKKYFYRKAYPGILGYKIFWIISNAI